MGISGFSIQVIMEALRCTGWILQVKSSVTTLVHIMRILVSSPPMEQARLIFADLLTIQSKVRLVSVRLLVRIVRHLSGHSPSPTVSMELLGESWHKVDYTLSL